ncbi:MAG: Mur ligase family protein [Gammaproteobacteria bacterium]|nr:Mur ligase family protein [Gammaproteobacteria bacterium]
MRSVRGEIASRFFGAPSERMLVVAVTGTNGKTSCCHFIAQALNASGHRCGVMGTLGYGMPGKVKKPGLTTPGAIDLQRRLAELLYEGASGVALEASSHGLAQQRLAGTAIDIAVFTEHDPGSPRLSRDFCRIQSLQNRNSLNGKDSGRR